MQSKLYYTRLSIFDKQIYFWTVDLTKLARCNCNLKQVFYKITFLWILFEKKTLKSHQDFIFNSTEISINKNINLVLRVVLV